MSSTAPTGFITRTAPKFENPREERQYRIQHLAAACRIFGSKGFSEGLLGHITVRDPIDTGTFWANPIGVSFNRMRTSDIVRVDHAGALIDGERPVNPVGVRLHSAIHKRFPDVIAVCHAHSTLSLIHI